MTRHLRSITLNQVIINNGGEHRCATHTKLAIEALRKHWRHLEQASSMNSHFALRVYWNRRWFNRVHLELLHGNSNERSCHMV
jgi:hypothetical protein